MATEVVEASKGHGPSGFLEINNQMLVVDYGKIYLDGTACGFLFEDGLMNGFSAPVGVWEGFKAIEEIPGCLFRGIDASGMSLELPGETGPTGGLTYNGIPFNVIYGRIATQDHRLVGRMDDAGTISLKGHKDPSQLVVMDEGCQLNTVFQGITSKAKPLNTDFVRPLHRKDRTYSDNEIIRYFMQFDNLNTVQKKYVLETMKLWASTGLLQVIRKSEGDCALGNVKHGASGVTGVRTGMLTLDREEFEKEITLYKRFGALAVVATRIRPYHEVRINLVVSHEYGHQLEFCLSQASQDRITELFAKRLQTCNRLHPLPDAYEGQSELVSTQQVNERIFVSGYSRSSMHEYWAEATAAFSVQESREMLKQCDPAVHDLLLDVAFSPEKMLSPRFEKDILKLQTSLKVGGELAATLLEESVQVKKP